ncbi:MAG: hypothetical protein JNN15_14835, partial [Blastocatellia bacterium]|nr:hypothetical protein [Blastocatellia bacterium]
SELSHDQGDSNRLYKTGATAALPAGLADAWASQSEKTEDAEEGAVNSSSAFYKASSVSRLVDPEMEETIDEVKADPSLLEADTVSAPALFAGNLDDFGSVMEKTEEVPVLTEVFETEERTEEVPILRMAREKQEELERAVKAEDKVPVVTSAIGNTSAAEKNVLARANPMPAVASVPVQSFAPVETPKSFTGALQGLQVERASQIERVVLIVSVVTAVLGLVILIWFWLIRPNTVSFNFRAESSIRENYKKLI